ncbi:Oxaloacetate decarboxylase [Streptomyces tendae]
MLINAGSHQEKYRRATQVAATLAYVAMAVGLNARGGDETLVEYVTFYLILALAWGVGAWSARRAPRRRNAAAGSPRTPQRRTHPHRPRVARRRDPPRDGAAAPGLFVNARTDTYWSGDGDPAETMRRLTAYREAGADGVFVPGLTDPARIASLAAHFDVPLNVLYSPAGPTLAHLADLGVRRVSLGSLLYRRALGAALETAAGIRAGRSPDGTTPTYDEVRALS